MKPMTHTPDPRAVDPTLLPRTQPSSTPARTTRTRSLGRLLAILLVLTAAPATRPEPVSSQITRADSAAVLLGAAARFEAEGRWDIAEALYQLITERFGDTPAGGEAQRILSAPPTERVSRSGRVELQVWSTLYGLWLGVAIPGAFGAEDPEPVGVGLLLGGPAGFFSGRALARSRSLSDGQARAITLGGSWGTWQGLGWAEVFDWGKEEVCSGDVCYEDGDSSEEIFATMIAGGLVGIATGAVLSRKPIPSGVASTVNFGTLWGTWFGVAFGVLADLEDDDLLASTLIGGDAGLLATALLSPGWNISRNRARLISIAGVIGGLGGAGLDLLIQPDDEKVAIGIPLVLSIGGLVIGAASTRDYDRPGQTSPGGLDSALLNLDGHRASLGLPAPFPTALPVKGPRGPSWSPALGLTLLQARF
jgi:hypothetical protein